MRTYRSIGRRHMDWTRAWFPRMWRSGTGYGRRVFLSNECRSESRTLLFTLTRLAMLPLPAMTLSLLVILVPARENSIELVDVALECAKLFLRSFAGCHNSHQRL